MFRILLTAYVSLVAACGPALCCCSFQHLATAAGSEGCCAKKAAHDGHAQHAGHSHHADHAHRHARHDHLAAAKPASGDQAKPADADSVPQVCDEHRCGCNRDKTQFVSLPKKHLGEQRGDWAAELNFVPVVSDYSLLRLPIAAQHLSSGTFHASLYGREMLRAYQILLI